MMAPCGLLFLLFASPCLSNKRLLWPTPRDDNTEARDAGPCGPVSFDEASADGRITEWAAGEIVEIIVFQEVHDSGQPMRLAISGENNDDFESCIWLNVRSLSRYFLLLLPAEFADL